jgi:hypothetical protein
VKFIQLLLAGAMLVGTIGRASADPVAKSEPKGAQWTLTLSGGALVPLGVMRDGYQDALVAGMRFGVRAKVGIGLELAVDYSPLPHREGPSVTSDTNYGTVALLPGWTLGSGTLRLQIAGGGGVALERLVSRSAAGFTEKVAMPAAIGQFGIQLHVTKGGGFVLLAGATKTFGDREYQYAWGMGGLTLDF